MTFLLALLGFSRAVITAVLTWLSHSSLAEIGCIVLGIACLALVVANRAEKQHSTKLQGQVVSLSAQLSRISDARKTQQIVTREKIKIVTQRIHDADGKAKVIEQAPLPGNCRSPKEVLDADI